MDKELKEMMARMAEWEAKNSDADLTQIEEAIDGELAALRKQLLEKMANKEITTTQKCPECGEEMMKNGVKKRELRTKNGSKIELKRDQMRCHQCGKTLFPPR